MSFNPRTNPKGKPITLSMSEVVSAVAEEPDNDSKVSLLRELGNTNGFRRLIQLAYNTEWKLPKGKPPYKPLEKYRNAEGNLYKAVMKIDPFIAGTKYENLNQTKRERLFIEMLEFVDADDAKLICSVKDGKIDGIDKDLAEEAFPGIFE